jgi:hypothetical protein
VGHLRLKLADPRLEQLDLLQQQAHRWPQQLRQAAGRVGQLAADLLQPDATALADGDAVLAAEPAQCVDAAGALSLPQAAPSPTTAEADAIRFDALTLFTAASVTDFAGMTAEAGQG